jgi:hypothetical protein
MFWRHTKARCYVATQLRKEMIFPSDPYTASMESLINMHFLNQENLS